MNRDYQCDREYSTMNREYLILNMDYPCDREYSTMNMDYPCDREYSTMNRDYHVTGIIPPEQGLPM